MILMYSSWREGLIFQLLLSGYMKNDKTDRRNKWPFIPITGNLCDFKLKWRTSVDDGRSLRGNLHISTKIGHSRKNRRRSQHLFEWVSFTLAVVAYTGVTLVCRHVGGVTDKLSWYIARSYPNAICMRSLQCIIHVLKERSPFNVMPNLAFSI